ncbi:hypothetical protein HK405_008308, partial [Cladochytrium tenue]
QAEFVGYDSASSTGASVANRDAVRSYVRNISGTPENDVTLLNSMRFGQIPCRLINTLYPDTVTKLHDARSTFATLENLAAYSAGLALRGIERKALFRPLEFANSTPRGAEMFVRNLVRLAIIASGTLR